MNKKTILIFTILAVGGLLTSFAAYAEAAEITVRKAAFMFPYMIPVLGIAVLRARYRSKKK